MSLIQPVPLSEPTAVTLHYWIVRGGYLAGEIRSTTFVDPGAKAPTLADVQATAPAGDTILDATTQARPPDAPLPVDPLQAKRDRLAQLRAIGWANLTALQQAEATALRFDLGE